MINNENSVEATNGPILGLAVNQQFQRESAELAELMRNILLQGRSMLDSTVDNQLTGVSITL